MRHVCTRWRSSHENRRLAAWSGGKRINKFPTGPGRLRPEDARFVLLSDQRLPQMKTIIRTATAAAAKAILLYACGGSPTGSAVEAGVTGPNYDGGYIIGPGNREAPLDSSAP